MKTRRMSPNDMDRRVARYADLKPTTFQKDAAQAERATNINPEALDLMEFGHSRQLLTIIGLDTGDTAITRDAPIVGAGGMTMTYAICPPGTGPPLHAHRVTFETFTVLQGILNSRTTMMAANRWSWNLLSVISIPPEVVRTFRNVSEGQGILQVVITGGVHDRGTWTSRRKLVNRYKRSGMTLSGTFSGWVFHSPLVTRPTDDAAGGARSTGARRI